LLYSGAKAFSQLQDNPGQELQNLHMTIAAHQLAADLVDRIMLDYRSDEAKLYLTKYEEQISENAI